MQPTAVRVSPAAATIALPSWVHAAAAAGAALASATIADAVALDAAGLRAAVAAAYRALFQDLAGRGVTHVVRAWNFVPDILGPMSDGGDRYMSFNAGRHDAMREHFSAAALPRHVPAGTGVGHAGGDLVIHLLAVTTPGEAIENPLQTPAYHYSLKYGPIPPCFARATRAVLPTGPRLLVAGTAAILGETTRHEHDLAAQLRLAIDNLRAVLANDAPAGDDEADLIDRFESLRAYVPPVADFGELRRSLPRCEIVPVADLCRRDLLVEIEGVAATRGARGEMR